MATETITQTNLPAPFIETMGKTFGEGIMLGEGDRDLGAKRMYDMMHKYEPIGRALS